VAHREFTDGGKKKRRRPPSPLSPEDHPQEATKVQPNHDYCMVCYRTQSAANKLKPMARRVDAAHIKKKQCKKTRFGCVDCGGVRVCPDCWPTYQHDFVPHRPGAGRKPRQTPAKTPPAWKPKRAKPGRGKQRQLEPSAAKTTKKKKGAPKTMRQRA